MTGILVPRNPTSNKNELASFVAYLFIGEMEAAAGHEGILRLKTWSNARLKETHDIAVSPGEYDYAIVSYIKKSLKQSYGGNRLFGLSTLEMNEYLTDVRRIIQNY